jgi:hypothetical protein
MAKKTDNLGINLKDFKLNEEGSFSITRPYESAQIIYLIENFNQIKFISLKRIRGILQEV